MARVARRLGEDPPILEGCSMGTGSGPYLGLDGFRGGWVAAWIDDHGHHGFDYSSSLGRLLSVPHKRAMIDMPIGLKGVRPQNATSALASWRRLRLSGRATKPPGISRSGCRQSILLAPVTPNVRDRCREAIIQVRSAGIFQFCRAPFPRSCARPGARRG